jgi:hypothetical protein
MLAALGLTIASACNRCDAPDVTTYSCSSMDASSPGCRGSPIGSADGGVDDGRIFPLGCVADLPYCNGYYGNSVQTCTCQDAPEPDAGPQWVCPV